ncbi:MAG TPA: hypothetical protein VGP93_17365 [Polyangiaceae bacterium]|nr:hypothetical protein [Polyangiaceae bacterium]
MAQPLNTWTVLPHGKLTALDDNLLTVVGDLPMPLGGFPRRMTVVRLKDARLVIFSAIALDEPEMQALESFGTPSFLIVPSDIHRMDAKIWKERYPALRVIAPEGARAKAEEVVHVDATEADFGDPSVRYVTVPGTEGHEAALVVETSSGTTLVVNDLIWNVHNRKGFGGWLYRMFGLTGPEPRIASVVRLRKIKDKPAVRTQLEAWSHLQGLNRIIVSHGSIVERDPPAVLRTLADTLAA